MLGRNALTINALSCLLAATAFCRQVVAQAPIFGRGVVIESPDDRSGPRIGMAYLTRGSETARRLNKSFSPLTSVFGWQFERPIDVGPRGWRVMTELVPLVGGLEQNVPLPSLTWLVAARKPNGIELGVGPTITGAGTQVTFAGGVTKVVGDVDIPVNFAFAPARRGAVLLLTAGFNTRRRP
jgi:hypothetical protein